MPHLAVAGLALAFGCAVFLLMGIALSWTDWLLHGDDGTASDFWAPVGAALTGCLAAAGAVLVLRRANKARVLRSRTGKAP